MATYTAETPYGLGTSIAYNTSKAYNSSLYTYNGQLVTVWTAETKNN